VYEAIPDGETFPLGKVTIQALHTPGHAESTYFLLLDGTKNRTGRFTQRPFSIRRCGATRPTTGGRISKEELAGMLFDSLHQKIRKPLLTTSLVYPAHGSGSSCGK